MKKLTLLVCLFIFNAQAALKITTFNIRNFDKKGLGTDKTELLKVIQNLDSDIIAVEEIFNDVSFEKFVNKELRGYQLALSTCGGGGQQKLGFLYKSERFSLTKIVEDSKLASPDDIVPQYGCASLRPAMMGFFKDLKANTEFVAVAVHLKAGGKSKDMAKRWQQYNYLTKMIRSLRLAKHENIIFLGDFNTTGYDKKDADFKKFSEMLKQSGTNTVSEKISCTSYWEGAILTDDIEEPSILDHIVYSPNFMGLNLKSVDVGTHCKVADCKEVYNSVLGRSYEAVSDHCPLTATFE